MNLHEEVGVDVRGNRVVANVFRGRDEQLFAMLGVMTPCCGASGKGLMDEPSGQGYIGCRKCYSEVDPLHGDAWTWDEDLDEPAKWARIARDLFDGNLEKVAGVAQSVKDLMVRAEQQGV
jgi:hypothetical protein